MRSSLKRAAAISTTFVLQACGANIPQIQEFWESSEPTSVFSAGGSLEYKIKQKVYCAIVDAAVVTRAKNLLPKHWSSQVTLDLQVDELGSLNPSVGFVRPMSAMQSFTFGLAGTLSSQGTREDKFGSYWNLDNLTGKTGNACDNVAKESQGSSLLLENDLGITEWLTDALSSENALSSSTLAKGETYFKQDYLSYHVKFIVVSSGGISPTWKMTRITSGTGSQPLASEGRTRTHDLLVTFGPTFSKNGLNLAVSSHITQELGIAVANGARFNVQPSGTSVFPF